jgi:hypothetical protein
MKLEELADAARLRLARFRLRAHYRRVFLSLSGRAVFEDLSRFAGVKHDLFRSDPREEAYLLGMRRVLLRIARYSTMSLDELESFKRAPEGGADEETPKSRTVEVQAREVTP